MRQQICVFCTESRKYVVVFCCQKQSRDCEGGHDTGYNKEPFSVGEASQGESLQSGADDHRAAQDWDGQPEYRTDIEKGFEEGQYHACHEN